jgi:hypothetical protein
VTAQLEQTEKQFQEAVIDFARALGWLVYHTFDSRRSAAGFPDLVLVRREQLIFAELKTERGRVSEPQQEWIQSLLLIERATARTVSVAVWRPSDWSLIEEILR